MNRLATTGSISAIATLILATSALADARHFPLVGTEGLTPHNVVVTPATLSGKKGIRVLADPRADVSAARAVAGGGNVEELVLLDGTEFGDGVIEVEVSGDIEPGADAAARGFVGIAFRVQKDLQTYDAFYLRPRNGRDADQLRRNHSTQYISHPDWTWSRLRKETPGVYESYVDLEMNTWTRIRIEVEGTEARLFVHGAPQPALVVQDVKSGATARGGVALWIGPHTIGHFRDLRITPRAPLANAQRREVRVGVVHRDTRVRRDLDAIAVAPAAWLRACRKA